MSVRPFKGMVFLHRRVLNEDNTPMSYVVTRIIHGAVYYRPSGWKGGSEFCLLDEFEARVCLEEIFS